jgi:hypothetical protein
MGLRDRYTDMIPLKVEAPEEYVNKHRQVELKDTAYYYFLNVSDYRGVGEENRMSLPGRK